VGSSGRILDVTVVSHVLFPRYVQGHSLLHCEVFSPLFSSRMLYFWAQVALLACRVTARHFQDGCKAKPGSNHWPSAEEWNNLNDTVGGALSTPSPSAAPCHKDLPDYDEEQCRYIKTRWNSSQWHSDHPTDALFPNVNLYSCLPNSDSPCRREAFPLYVINVTKIEHIKAGINFAREKNVRLNIKSTGHDFMGKYVNSRTREVSSILIGIDLPSQTLYRFGHTIFVRSNGMKRSTRFLDVISPSLGQLFALDLELR